MEYGSGHIEAAYRLAEEQYAEIGVDVAKALRELKKVAVSLHCWQGDDVRGFERRSGDIGGGLAVTGNYPGRARNADELRADVQLAYSLIPGNRHRFNLHATYAETNGEAVDRDELRPEHFARWMDWASEQQLGLDFNPTYFAHPNAESGWTLSHPDAAIRQFWIDHGIACRRIGDAMGRKLGTPCVTNVWIPDGSKDTPVDRKGPRERLTLALDDIFCDSMPSEYNLDAVECKLFGLGSESYVVGSHEFYLSYAIARQIMLCLDAGHFHPTETISDKLSAVLPWVPEVLLHVSRGIRWDSDHVVVLNDEVIEIAHQVVRGEYLSRIHFGLDFFDASINRVAAWVIGTRALLKALLYAFLEPTYKLLQYEREGDLTARLAMMEEIKTMPFGVVWQYYCLQSDVPNGQDWLRRVRQYEADVLSSR